MNGSDWDEAPCGLLVLSPDGTVLRANRTLLEWTGRDLDELAGRVRLPELLSVGGRIFWETHLAPRLRLGDPLDEVAVELRAADARVPVLLSARTTGGQVQVALSIARERSAFERELVVARAGAEQVAAQLRALQATTAALSRALGTAGVAEALLWAAVVSCGAQAASVWLVGADTPWSSGETAAADPPPVPLHAHDAYTAEGRVVVPLQGATELQGVLSVRPRDDPASEPLDLEVLTAVGQQAGLALDRAQLHELSARVARELQHSLLAVEPTADPRFTVATVYRAGVEALEVGGDWHDVFVVEHDRLHVVVGDVVGRGLGAASAMGQLRGAVHAVAGPGLGPAHLLTRLDAFVDQVEAAGMATVVVAEVDLASGLVRYACAGHPPPVLLPAAGGGRLLWGGRSTPLGAYGPGEHRAQASVQLEPGDRLLLYTDGLVERRDRGLDEGLDLLVRTAAALGPQPVDELVRGLTEAMLHDESGRDDVCVLLLQWAGPPFERRVNADLSQLSAVRHELADWLLEHGLDEEGSADLVLAASEALAGAAGHGAGRRAADTLTVRARVEAAPGGEGEVVVTVQAPWRWTDDGDADLRGRRLAVIEALVPDVRTSTGAGTTVALRQRLPAHRP